MIEIKGGKTISVGRKIDITTNTLLWYGDAANKNSYNGGTSVKNLISSQKTVGTLTNGATWSPQNGGIFILDGVDDYVGLGDTIPTASLTYPFTIETWVNPSPTGNTAVKGIFVTDAYNTTANYFGLSLQTSSASDSSGNYNIAISIGNGTSFGIGGRRSLISNSKVLIGNRWNHLVATIATGPTFQLFINGVSVAGTLSGTATTLVWGVNSQTRWGDNWAGSASSRLLGSIASSKFYNRLLSQAEIINSFNASKSRFGYI